MAKRWTEDEIALFWEMKEGGASLREIAVALGRPYTAVMTKASELKKSGPEDMSHEDCRREALEEQARMFGNTNPCEAKKPDDGLLPAALAAAEMERAKLGETTAPEPAKPRTNEQMLDTAMACARRCGFELSRMHIEYNGEGLDIQLGFAPTGAAEVHG